MTNIRVLSGDDIRRLVTMADAIGLMRDAFAELSTGSAIVPQRINVEMNAENSRALIMPAYSRIAKKYSIKAVTLSGNNPSKNLPFIHGLLLLFDADVGAPLAMLDAEYVTALRTGAASGLATNLLARRDVKTAMVFGAGTQARTQIAGIAAVRKLDHVLVYSTDRRGTERFCAEMTDDLGLQVLPSDSPSRVSEADIVCTATTSQVPVFDDQRIMPGVHLNGIGSYKASMQEIPSPTIRRAKVIVDSKAAALKEAGDIVIPLDEGEITSDHIYAELGEIVLGRKPGRTDDQEVTIFKSVGNAIQDLTVAAHALRMAEEKDVGTQIQL